MVCFTCSYCGDSVKKAAVVKHYQTKCRKKDPFLTCIDCLKDFRGNEHEAHTKCITEEEKYSAKGFVPKPSQNKGERKQQVWQECMQVVLKKPTLKPDEKDLIRAVSKYENVPRKKPKFINFLTHAFRQYANKNDLIDRVWMEMETVFKEMSAKDNEENTHHQQHQQQQQQPKQPKQETKNVAKTNTKPEDNSAKKDNKRKKQPEADEKSGKDSGRSDDKQKKKKQKTNEEKIVEGNDDNNDVFMYDYTELKKDKKSRKRKADEDSQTEQNHSVADEGEPGKKKKKKKNDKPAENQVNETPQQKGEEEAKKKKNKKPKTPNANATNATEVKANVESGKSGAGDSNAPKKEKKAKKSENKENCEQKPPVKKAKNEQPGEGEKPAPQKKKAGDEKPEQFDWKVTILQVFNQDGKNNKIQLQKLQKRVLKLHCQAFNCEVTEKKEKRFMKELKDIQNLVIDKDFVVLKS